MAACLWISGCKAKEGTGQPPAGSQEMKVEQTPVNSIYDEKGGVLYERPAVTPTPHASPAVPTPSPSSSAPRASEDKTGRGLPAEASAKAGKG